MRRADIIRQEIEDLERLLQGNYPQWKSRECRAWWFFPILQCNWSKNKHHFFFFFNRSDANLNQVWLYLFLFTQFASFYFEFSLARWDIYFLLIGSIKMHCNGRGFNNWGGGDCRWSPVARRPWIWILQVVSCDLEFRLLSVQALFLMPRILEIAFSRLYLCVYILFFWGGGYEPFPPPLSEKGTLHPLPQPFLLHRRQPRIESVIKTPE